MSFCLTRKASQRFTEGKGAGDRNESLRETDHYGRTVNQDQGRKEGAGYFGNFANRERKATETFSHPCGPRKKEPKKPEGSTLGKLGRPLGHRRSRGGVFPHREGGKGAPPIGR